MASEVKVGINASQADVSGFQKAMHATDGFIGRVMGMNGALAGLRSQLVALAGAGGIMQLARAGITMNASIETAAMSFRTLLKGADAASARVRELYKFAAETPFEFTEVLAASRILQSMTEGAMATGEGLRLVGDAASASGRSLEEVAMWVGRLYAGLKSGTPVGEATLRLIEMGLVSGETARQLNGLVEQGALGAKAFDTLRNALGQFSGSMELQSRTFTGRLSTMKDALNAFIGERTRGLFESLKVAMEGFTRVLTSREMETAMDRLSGLFIGGALAAGITAAWAALAKLVAEMKVLVWVVQSTNLATGLGMMFTTAQVAAMGLAAQIGLVVTAMWTLVEAWRALNAQQAMTDARAGLEATTTRARTGLEEEIQRRVASGSLSADRAAALRADLAAGFAGKEVPKYAYESTFTGGVQRVRRGSETVRDADAEAAAIKRVGEALREVEQARVGNAEMLGPTSDEVTLQERYLAGRKALSDNNRALEQWLADQEANEGGSIYGPTADEVAKQEDYLRQREDRFAEMEQAAALYRAEQAAANNFTTQLRSEMQQLAAQWGTMAQGMARAITGTVVNAVQGLSNALANVIVGTQSAAQAFSQFAVQMLTSFIASLQSQFFSPFIPLRPRAT